MIIVNPSYCQCGFRWRAGYNNPAERSFVIYGITTEQSISRLFIAGIIPGILLTLMYIAVIWLTVSKNPDIAPAASGPVRVSKKNQCLNGCPADVLIVFGIAVGGLFAGWFTPTEAGGIGAAGVY